MFTKIIERNTTIPTKGSEIFTTAEDNQPSVMIQVYQGEREMARDNKSLGNFELTGLPPAPRNVPQIEVTFDIDANGIVHVNAKDLATGKEQRMTVTGGSALPKDDIDKMVRDAEQYAEEDRKRREAVENRNQAEGLVYQTEKFLSENEDKIPDDVKTEVKDGVDELKKALEGDRRRRDQGRVGEARPVQPEDGRRDVRSKPRPPRSAGHARPTTVRPATPLATTTWSMLRSWTRTGRRSRRHDK